MKRLVSLVSLIVILEGFDPTPNGWLPAADRVDAMKPKLVLAIIVDQFRYDYLLRFNNDYKSGVRQLLVNGAVFSNANLEHFPTFTSVGHAAFLTGAYPALSGIVGNSWYDRDSGKTVASASDDSVTLVGGTDRAGSSPHNLLVSTIGDEMKMANQGNCKVVGISLKDYSSILATGHMADGVYWFDSGSGSFVSSTYYVSELPEWVRAFNAKRPADRYRGAEWLDTKLPGEANSRLYGMLQYTPYGNDLIEEMAEEVIKAEKLGHHSQPDLLMISFSSNDYVGHQHGPDSPQVRGIATATDEMLGKLFKFVDSHVGMKNVTVVFSADHGVAPLPEVNLERKMPGGRLSFAPIRDAIEKSLEQEFGAGKWIAGTPEESIYLNWDLIKEKKLAREEVARVAAQAALAAPHVFRVYTRDQLLNGYAMEDPIGQCLMRSYSARRSADLYILMEPYYIFGKLSTTHGSAFGYDTHVPVIFMGPGIKAGKYHSSIAINDIAPTLATILEVEIPSGSEGRILSEMFSVP
jgi:predicted AlkP superfamily pyrophosphatase or phosphodiesterase